MNATLNTSFDSLEQSLDMLIESITTYNPSPSAAALLIAADNNVSAALEQLAVHQANVGALQALRAQANALDARIKANLTSLADLRTELTRQSPTDSSVNPLSQTDYRLLLDTAQRIAPQTRPPVPWQQQQQSRDDTVADRPTQTELSTQTQTQSATQPGSEISQSHLQQSSLTEKPAPTVLEPEQQAYLDTTGAAAAVFTPWPNESAIWSGSLGRLQNSEQDPAMAISSFPNKADSTAAEETKPVNGDSTRVVLSEEELDRRRREAEEKRRAADEELGQFDLYDPDEE